MSKTMTTSSTTLYIVIRNRLKLTKFVFFIILNVLLSHTIPIMHEIMKQVTIIVPNKKDAVQNCILLQIYKYKKDLDQSFCSK